MRQKEESRTSASSIAHVEGGRSYEIEFKMPSLENPKSEKEAKLGFLREGNNKKPTVKGKNSVKKREPRNKRLEANLSPSSVNGERPFVLLT